MKKQRKIICLLLIAAILCCVVLLQRQRSCPLPVLMYHHFTEDAEVDTCVTPETFRKQLTALRDAGFTSVTIEQVLNYVKCGIPLPEKPVLITIDDGYTSNITLAAPILEELGMCATIFVIGIYEGMEVNFRTGNPIYPERFSFEEAAVWVEKGVLDLQCHSFDMHQRAADGFSGRDGMLAKPDEEEESYRAAVKEDIKQFRNKRDGYIHTPLTALAYPYGYYTQELDQILQEEGIQVTFTIDGYCSRIRVWDKSSLRMLGRYNVSEYWQGDALTALLEQKIAE